MKRLLVLALVLMVWLLLIAATGSSQSTAIAIATVAALILPFVLKYVPAVGHYMVAIVLVLSFVIAAGAELLTGEIVLSNLQATDASTLFAMFLSVYALSQVVYSVLTQSPKTSGAVS